MINKLRTKVIALCSAKIIVNQRCSRRCSAFPYSTLHEFSGCNRLQPSDIVHPVVSKELGSDSLGSSNRTTGSRVLPLRTQTHIGADIQDLDEAPTRCTGLGLDAITTE